MTSLFYEADCRGVYLRGNEAEMQMLDNHRMFVAVLCA